VVWQFTETEITSAMMKAARATPPLLDGAELERAFTRLDRIAGRWEQVAVLTDPGLMEIRAEARRLMRAYTIHSADSLQLAAALLRFARPMRRSFVVSDGLVARAAEAEGFRVIVLRAPGRRKR